MPTPRHTFTYNLYSLPTEDLRMQFQGPILNDYNHLRARQTGPLYIIATSAGAALLIDWCEYVISNKQTPQHDVHLFLITRNVELLRFICYYTSKLYIPNAFFHLCLTSMKTGERICSKDGTREILLDRPDFESILSKCPETTSMQYCGNYRLKSKLVHLTRKYNLKGLAGTGLSYSKKRHSSAKVDEKFTALKKGASLELQSQFSLTSTNTYE